MNTIKLDNFNELTSKELNEVDGGGIVTVISVVGGCIAIASAAYDFCRGFSEGWNSVN